MASVGKSVSRAIEEWENGELDFAMLHACNAVDGTASKLHPNLANKARFIKFIRDNYEVFVPMGLPGIDAAKTRWPIDFKNPGKVGTGKDIAEIIYVIHRCTQGHGDELPEGFELIPDVAGPDRLTRTQMTPGTLRISDRTIFALLAIAVVSRINLRQRVPDGYFLSFAGTRLLINDMWGDPAKLEALIANEPMPLVTLDFSLWERKA